MHEVLDFLNQREMSVREFRVCLKKVIGRYGTKPTFCQLDFPAGKMVSYSKFEECHLALSSLKRTIKAFLGKLFLKTIVCCFIT